MQFNYIIVAAIVSLLVIVFLFKGIKKIAAWALLAFLALALFGTVFGFNLFTDITDIVQNFPTAKKLFLLKDEQILAGFESSLTDTTAIDAAGVASFQSSLNKNDLDSIRGNYYKLIIIDTKTFADLDSITSELSTKPFSGDDLLDAIRADNTLEQLTGIIIKTQNMPDTPQVRGYVADNLKKSKISTNADARATLFAQLVQASTKDQSLLIKSLKSDAVIIYPETITFKLAKVLPSFITEKIVGAIGG